MAKGAAPSQDQLLELMKRAAEELKHAQEEARTAVLALQKEQSAHQKTELELEQAQKQAKGAKSQQSTDEELLKDQIEAERENAKALDARVKELEAGLEGAISERETLRAKLGEGETAVSVAVQQEEAKQQKLIEEHQKAIAALKEEAQKTLEEALAESKEEATTHKGMLDDAAGNLVTMETQLNQEKDKHQATAQKLLEARSKVRELEASVTAEHERVKGLETAAKQFADAHEKSLKDQADANQKANAEMAQNHQLMQDELARVTERWHEVERQYESLHREMLLTLEQRDEARRLLENEKSERERLMKVLQTQHR